jgi:hypothetical protein
MISIAAFSVCPAVFLFGSVNISMATLVLTSASSRSALLVDTAVLFPMPYVHSRSTISLSMFLKAAGRTVEATLQLGKAWTGAVSGPGSNFQVTANSGAVASVA